MASERVVQAGEVRLARIESMRALAALAVLEAHLWGRVHDYDPAATLATLPQRLLFAGGAGVWIFFALSGYLLFWPFVRRHFAEGETIRLGAYARNRALRIVPLYVTAVAVLMVLGGHAGDGTLWWRHLLGVQAAWPDSLDAVDGPLWSVVVEMQFYVLLPLFALALAVVSRRSLARAGVLLGLIAAASLVARLRLDTDAGRPWAYQLPTTFFFFAAGMAVAMLRQALAGRSVRLGPPGAWLAAGVAAVGLFAWHFDQDWWCALAGFFVVGALVLPLGASRALRALDWRPLVGVGVASYSLYVWHNPIVDAVDPGSLAGAALVAALCVAVALVSYRLVEAPVLRARRQWARSAARQLDQPAPAASSSAAVSPALKRSSV